MTTDIRNARLIRDRLFAVEPQVDTRIPGTPFVVWHDGSVERLVSILGDGALDLGSTANWIVRTT